MNLWLLKDKMDFVKWTHAADHIGKDKTQIDQVGIPSVYPVVIVWQWGYPDIDLEELRYKLHYTFVSPRDFEYVIP